MAEHSRWYTYPFWWWWFSRLVVSDSCDPVDCSPPGFSVHGNSQARILEWVAISSSGDLPDPGMEPTFPTLQVVSCISLPAELPGKPILRCTFFEVYSFHSGYFCTFAVCDTRSCYIFLLSEDLFLTVLLFFIKL